MIVGHIPHWFFTRTLRKFKHHVKCYSHNSLENIVYGNSVPITVYALRLYSHGDQVALAFMSF